MNNELTAALLTIEKCRELTNCPAGVDLQDWVKQLAAENVGLTEFITQSCYVFDGEQHEISDAYICATDGGMPETPATDRIVAGIKADGVEEFAKYISLYSSNSEQHAINFAKQLREGADK